MRNKRGQSIDRIWTMSNLVHSSNATAKSWKTLIFDVKPDNDVAEWRDNGELGTQKKRIESIKAVRNNRKEEEKPLFTAQYIFSIGQWNTIIPWIGSHWLQVIYEYVRGRISYTKLRMASLQNSIFHLLLYYFLFLLCEKIPNGKAHQTNLNVNVQKFFKTRESHWAQKWPPLLEW